MANWSEDLKKLLDNFFPGTMEEDGYALKINTENAGTALQYLAEYAFIIFKCLSEKVNYDLKYDSCKIQP